MVLERTIAHGRPLLQEEARLALIVQRSGQDRAGPPGSSEPPCGLEDLFGQGWRPKNAEVSKGKLAKEDTYLCSIT